MLHVSRANRGNSETIIIVLISRALDMREYLVIIRENFCLFCIKTCGPSSERSAREVITYGFEEK